MELLTSREWDSMARLRRKIKGDTITLIELDREVEDLTGGLEDFQAKVREIRARLADCKRRQAKVRRERTGRNAELARLIERELAWRHARMFGEICTGNRATLHG